MTTQSSVFPTTIHGRSRLSAWLTDAPERPPMFGVIVLLVAQASTISIAGELDSSTAPSAVCPSWCFLSRNRYWACDVIECAPCQEACLATLRPTLRPERQMPKGSKLAADFAPLANTWTCAPVWPPQQLFVLFAMARSASTTVCHVINTFSDSHCAYEMLNPTPLHVKSASERDAMLRDPESFMKAKFESTFSDIGVAPCTWGFKLFPDHSDNATFHNLLWEQLNSAIILKRLNGKRDACEHRCSTRP